MRSSKNKNMKTVQAFWEDAARGIARSGDQHLWERSAELHPDWSEAEHTMMITDIQFGKSWVDAGRITYELTHSLAALFSLTSSPNIDCLPHHAFTIKVPREFLPLKDAKPSPDTWIAVGERAGVVAILTIADADSLPFTLTQLRIPQTGATLEKEPASPQTGEAYADHVRIGILARRFVANTIAYVLSHHDQPGCVEGKQVAPKQTTFLVRPPRNIVIDRAFRDAARAAVQATSLVGTRRALAHFVRGHWRNQAVGANWSERRRTWIHPHRRGDESLGSVVARTERLLGDAPT